MFDEHFAGRRDGDPENEARPNRHDISRGTAVIDQAEFADHFACTELRYFLSPRTDREATVRNDEEIRRGISRPDQRLVDVELTLGRHNEKRSKSFFWQRIKDPNPA